MLIVSCIFDAEIEDCGVDIVHSIRIINRSKSSKRYSVMYQMYK